MKVNITGRGFIPGINSIAPAYNVDIDITAVKRILNFKQFRVFDSETGIIITKKNVDAFKAERKPVEKKVEKKSKKSDKRSTAEEKTVTEIIEAAPVAAEYNVSDTVDETAVDETVQDEAIVSNDETIEEVVETAEPVVDEAEETNVVEETAEVPNNNNAYHNNNKKNRNKNKNRNNN